MCSSTKETQVSHTYCHAVHVLGTLRLSATVGYDGWMSVTQHRQHVRCHRRSFETVCFRAVFRRVEDG